jgi:hypothetical protein
MHRDELLSNVYVILRQHTCRRPPAAFVGFKTAGKTCRIYGKQHGMRISRFGSAVPTMSVHCADCLQLGTAQPADFSTMARRALAVSRSVAYNFAAASTVLAALWTCMSPVAVHKWSHGCARWKPRSPGSGPRRQVTRMMPIGVPRVPYRSQKEGSWQWVDIWNCLVICFAISCAAGCLQRIKADLLSTPFRLARPTTACGPSAAPIVTQVALNAVSGAHHLPQQSG